MLATRTLRRPRARLQHALLVPSPAPTVRFLRFAAVGTLGYGVNLGVFDALVREEHVPYLAAATASFAVAVTFNYLLNRAWTFRDARGPFLGQGARFAAVSGSALLVNLFVLHLLVRLGLGELAAQSLAVAVAVPVNFAGNRLWAFRAAPTMPPTRVFAPGAPAAVRAAVCLPTYDERENLEPMLLALRRVLEPSDVIVVVDDASPDGTGELADELAARLGGVHVLHRGGKQGLGAAYVEGFRYALGLGARFVVELDCDFSHDPNDVPRLLAAADAAGLALGSRNVTGAASPGLSPRRRLVSRAGSAYARRVLGLGVSDLTGGFKCFRRDVLEAVDPERLRSSGYAFQIETTYRAARAGYTPVELPIRFGDRAGGASKMSLGIAFEAAWRVPALRAAALAERVRASERAAAYRAVALWWAVSRMLVLGTALTVQALRWPRASWYPSLHRQPLALLGAWDGRWYRMVAERGYLAVPHHQSDVAFFPLFPVLLGALRRAGLSLDTSGLLLANLGLLVGLAALYELARTWLPQQAAVRTAVYAAVFPMGYVFSMVYPEALVLAAMALAGVFAARGRWAAAAVAAAVGGFARPEAMFLVVPLLVLAARRWRTLGDRDRRRALAAVGAAPAAVAGVALYDWRTFGNALAFSTAQRAWGRWFSPDGVARAVGELARAPGTQNVWLFRDAGLCVLYVLLLVAALRAGVPGSWVVAGGLIVLLPLESGSFTSDGRFGLLALPVYAGLGAAGSRPWLDRLVRCSGVVLLVAASATLLLRWP